jgi:hypothetical protein
MEPNDELDVLEQLEEVMDGPAELRGLKDLNGTTEWVLWIAEIGNGSRE